LVINYKRLNDNTIEDSYMISEKDSLLDHIQDAKVFNKFDYKSKFHQIKMHPDSIE
jgi:hypothetical protein